MAIVPMFPLGTTLLPGSVLPLHVFEPRYVAMLRELLADDDRPPEFGVVMIERGHEVGGGDVRSDIGVIGRVVSLDALPGDRYSLIAVGTTRFRVVEWLQDDPYPRADVATWPDPDDVPDDIADRFAAVLERARRLNELAREIGRAEMPDLGEMGVADEVAPSLYKIAALTPLGPVDRHRVLAAPTLGDRCDVLAQAIDDARAVLEFGRS